MEAGTGDAEAGGVIAEGLDADGLALAHAFPLHCPCRRSPLPEPPCRLASEQGSNTLFLDGESLHELRGE